MNFKYFSQASGKWDLGTQDLSTFEFEIKFRFNAGATTRSWYEILTSGTVTSTANDDVELAIGIYSTGNIDVYWGQSSGGTTYTYSFNADPYSWHVLRKFMQNGKLICTLDGNYPRDSTGFVPASTSRNVTLFAQSGYYTGYRPADYKVDVEYIKLNTTTYTAQYINGIKELRDSLGNSLPGSTNSSYPLTITGYGLENLDMKQITELTIPEGSVKKIENSNGDIIWGSQSAFPYRRLEYIESVYDTAVVVDLNFYATSATKVDIDLSVSSSPYSGWGPLWGTRGTGSNKSMYFCLFWNPSNNKVSTNYGNFDPGNNSTVTFTPNTIYNIRNNAGYFYVDNTYQSSISTSNTLVTSDKSFVLFGVANVNGYYTRNTEARVYKCVVTEGNTVIRTLYPAQRKSDNEIGLYDVTNNVFYTGSVANGLTAGSVVDEYWDLTAPS